MAWWIWGFLCQGRQQALRHSSAAVDLARNNIIFHTMVSNRQYYHCSCSLIGSGLYNIILRMKERMEITVMYVLSYKLLWKINDLPSSKRTRTNPYLYWIDLYFNMKYYLSTTVVWNIFQRWIIWTPRVYDMNIIKLNFDSGSKSCFFFLAQVNAGSELILSSQFAQA